MSANKINSILINNHIKLSGLSGSDRSSLNVKSVSRSFNEDLNRDKFIKSSGNPKEEEIRLKSSPHLKNNSPISDIYDSQKAYENRAKNVSRKSFKLNLNSVEIEDADFVEVNDNGEEIGKGYYYSSGSTMHRSTKNEINKYLFEKYTNNSILRKGNLVNLVV